MTRKSTASIFESQKRVEPQCNHYQTDKKYFVQTMIHYYRSLLLIMQKILLFDYTSLKNCLTFISKHLIVVEKQKRDYTIFTGSSSYLKEKEVKSLPQLLLQGTTFQQKEYFLGILPTPKQLAIIVKLLGNDDVSSCS